MPEHTPHHKPKMSPKDFFLYVGVAITLYISAGSLITLLFALIDAHVYDALDMLSYTGGIRFALAVMIVIFPVYLFLSWYIRKDIITHEEKHGLAIRRWFIYLTLFLASAVVLGDVIALVNTFLNGEITVRFILKMLAVLVVGMAVFSYYLYDLRRIKDDDRQVRSVFIWASGLGVLATIIAIFFVIGSPQTNRAERFDQERVWHLDALQYQILEYWRQTDALPNDLNDLEDDFSYFEIPVDPETGVSYVYTRHSDLSFELCATFARPSGDEREYSRVYDPHVFGTGNFEHAEGYVCFERTIDPEHVAKEPLPLLVPERVVR